MKEKNIRGYETNSSVCSRKNEKSVFIFQKLCTLYVCYVIYKHVQDTIHNICSGSIPTCIHDIYIYIQ